MKKRNFRRNNGKCTVTISGDPSSIGPDATLVDLGMYAQNLEDLLNDEFGGGVTVELGSVMSTQANRADVLERVQDIEQTDEWLSLLEE